MAINFPANPNINDVHTEASLGKSWKWDGSTWIIYSSSTTGIAFGDLSVSQQAASGSGSLTYNNAGVFTYTPPVASSTTFTALGDTPSTLTSDKWLKVNSQGTALEWADAPSGGGGGTNTTYDLTASSGSVVTEEKIKLSGSDNSEDSVTLAVDANSGLTIARANNTITFSGSPTSIAVANENIDVECYPLFTTEATGNLAPKTVTSLKLNSSTGQLEAGSFKKTGGASSEFLKADGSIDSNTYSQSNHTHSYSLNDLSNVDAVTGAANGKILKYNGASWEMADDLTGGGNTYGNSDVDTHLNQSNPNSGHVLSWNGSDYQWVAQSGGGGGSGGGNVAVGSIMIWSGAANAIPTGWQLCDGTNGSPDLRERFVVGAGGDNPTVAGSGYAVDATGGSKDATLVLHSHTINNHTHTFSDSFSGNTGNQSANHTHGFNSNATANVQTAYGTGSNALYGGTTNALNSGTVPITFTLSDTGGQSANHTHAFSGSVSGTTGNPSDTGTNDQGSSGTDANLPPYYSLCYIYCTAAGSNQNFIGLNDTPGSYTADKWLKVNGAGNGVEFTDAPAGNNTTYTLSAVQGGTSVNIRLTGSDSTEDNVLLTPGTGLSLASITADGFTINSTDTLDTITGRGATTNNDVTVGSITCNNLTVNGTTTTVNSNTVNIGDSNLTLNSDEAGTPSQNGGLTIERGTSDNVEIRWNETTDKWQYTNDGTNYSDIGSSSASTFLELSDTPSSFTADKWLKADVGGLSWTDPITYDMVTDAVTGGGIIRLTNELDNTTDDIQILGGTNITVSRSADHKLTINSDITNLNSLSDVTVTGSPGDDSILQYNTSSSQWEVVDGDSVGTTIPTGTIVMFNGTTAPAGWVLCDNSSQAVAAGAPDLRDKFIIGAGNSYTFDDTGGSADAVIVSHDHGGSSNTGSQSANHNHNAGNQSANHTHGDGNYNTNATGDHYHEQSGSGSGTTGNQSVNHFHTIGSGTTDGTPAKTSANTSGGTHGHGFQGTDRHPQSNMSGIVTEGGSGGNINNTYIQSSSGSHNHSVDLTGVTTGGINTNHTHNFSFNIGGNTTYSSIGNHSHNVQGSSGSESSNHTHNLGNQNANHTHSFNIGTQGVSGSGKNIPPYYALTFIMKT